MFESKNRHTTHLLRFQMEQNVISLVVESFLKICHVQHEIDFVSSICLYVFCRTACATFHKENNNIGNAALSKHLFYVSGSAVNWHTTTHTRTLMASIPAVSWLLFIHTDGAKFNFESFFSIFDEIIFLFWLAE